MGWFMGSCVVLRPTKWAATVIVGSFLDAHNYCRLI